MQISGESVVAESGTQFDWDFVALPGNRPTWVPKWGFLTSAPTFDPRFDIGGQFGGWHYGVKAYAGYGGEIGSDKEAKRGPDVNEYSDFAGVFGTGIYVTGVAGTSVNNVGVYGQAGDPPTSVNLKGLTAGVLGVSSGANDALGVFGISDTSSGVAGLSSSNPGAFGVSLLNIGVLGGSGDHGPILPRNIPFIAGVVGTANLRPGVIGTSTYGAGLVGYSTTQMGVYGETGATGPNSSAGYFRGNVIVVGDFTVVGGTKAAAVPFPDGSQRVLYCMESPELWFEDFGTAKLKRGRAVINLDADFGKVIKRGEYRVFLTPEGDCRGLYVRRKSAASFEVRELAGGTSSVAFSYRIVGRRKDIRAQKRFTKIDTRLPLPAAATRAARKPTRAALRKFAASLGKDARASQAKDAMKARRLRALRKRSRA
jgi:hypothetical protein